MKVSSWHWSVLVALSMTTVLALGWFWTRPTASGRLESAIAERCLPPLELPDAIRTCLGDYTGIREKNLWDRDGDNAREQELFDCMALVGVRASSRPWGVPMGACVVAVARRLEPDDPYALLPPCPEQECGIAAQVREVEKWANRFCRARYPEGPPPDCG